MTFCVSPLGLTGHAEVVRVVLSPKDVGLEELLKRFWESRDPTRGSDAHMHTNPNPKLRPQIRPIPRGHGVY